MRYPASEKLEIIRLIEQSHLPVRRTQVINVLVYIEMFYNSKLKHVRNGMLLPVEF